MDRETALGYDDDEGRGSPRENLVPIRTDTPGPMPTYQYSREKLLSLKTCTGAKKRPSCLNEDFNTAEGLWDPERWFRSFDNSRGNSPMIVGEREWKRSGGDQDRDLEYIAKRRPSDPKERLKEEKDGIVLSPQRRSFGTGCHVSQVSVSRQISCPADFKDGNDRDRERNPRRIGSGRIQIDRDRNMDRDRDRDRDQPRDLRGERDFRAIRDRYNDDRDRDRRFDRDRGFRRDFEERREFSRHYNNNRDRDGGRVRRDSYNRHHGMVEDEPEWFTGGPTSQTDTIELRGFEKPEEKKEKRVHRHMREEETDLVDEERRADMVEERNKDDDMHNREEEKTSSDKRGVGGVANVVDRNGSLETNESSSSPDELNHTDSMNATSPHPENIFDFNEFFKTDLPGLQDGPSPGFDLPGVQSRFSQWFVSRHSGSHHNSRENSRRSSFNEDFNYLNDLLSGTRSPIIPSPPPPSANSVFDPSMIFSPANSTFADKPQHSSVDSPGLHRAAIGPLLSSIFQNSGPSQDRSGTNSPGNISIQDAETQLKALLFGKKSFTPSSSGTGTPGMSSPLNVSGKVKTLAELEADLKQQQHSSQPAGGNFTPPPLSRQQLPPPQQPSSQFQSHQFQQQPPPPVGPPPMPQQPPQPQLGGGMRRDSQDEGDLTAFNKLLSLMQAGAAEAVQSPKLPPKLPNQRPESPKTQMQLQQPSNPMSQPPPQISAQSLAQNEFMQALIRNKEQQLHIRHHTLQQIRIHNTNQNTSSPQQQGQNQPSQQQLFPPPGGDPVLNFIKQNPTIITKSASPTPPPQQIPSQPPLHSTTQQQPPPAMIGLMNPTSPRAPSPIQVVAANLVPQPPSSPRVPSPIMFSQQPPMHLSAPSPIHPSQMPHSSPIAVPITGNTMTSTATIRPPSVPRVPSPQELIAHTQAIMQTALLKKQLEDQKERFIKKQQERGKSPNPINEQMMKQPQTSTPVVSQAQPQTKPSVTVAFTPTSVMRKMHSDKASEKEKATEKDKQGPEGVFDSPAPVPPIRQLIKPDGTPNTNEQVTSHDGIQQHPNVSHIQMINNIDQLPNMSGPPPPLSSLNINSLDQGQVLTDSKHATRALVGQGAMQASIPVQIQGVQSFCMASGRPIVKGGTGSTTTTPSQGRPMMGGIQVSTPQVRPDQNQTTPLQRPIVGSSGHIPVSTPAADINKLLQQRQINISPNPLTRPVPGTPVTPGMPYGSIPITGRIPVQTNVPPVNVANTAIIQQMMQGGIRSAATARANALNQMNHLSQINQLAIQAQQQRIVDPRLQGIRGVYPGVPTTGLGPRVQTSLGPPPVGLNGAINRTLSPQVTTPKSMMNGPLSPVMPTSVHSMVFNSNNNISKPGDPNLLKWFGNDVLKNQMPNMPPLPAQGQRVMTVDEIERCQQQAVTN